MAPTAVIPSPPEQFPDAQAPAPGPAASKGWAIAAIVLGGAAFLTGLLPWLGLILAITAVAAGVLALVKKQSKGLAITGLALGAVGLLTGLIVTIGFTSILNSGARVDLDTDSAPQSSASASATPEAPESTPEPEQPQPEPTPAEQQPAAADGTVAHPYPQPYTARGLLGGEKYTLTGRIVDANAGAAVKEWNMFNSDAPAGFKYVVIELTMTGIDPDGVEPSLAEWDLYLATGEGNRYSSEATSFGDDMASLWEGPTLYPGSSFTGYAAYVVPESATTFFLYDNRNYVSF
ncbi:DUF4190 domain-containing protein [Microbacterium sp. NPDC089189]|uniref:DUF4190 domain-containing protein n=1 Tax=Microbacterium sp. NPDC089189 TaxID=3154972 RepID=UPI003419AEF2